MDYKALMDAKEAEDAIKESKVSLTKKIKEALELIRSFEPLEEWRGQEDPETSEDLVREIKKILEK